MSEDEGGEMQIKLKKKKTRIPKISKEENNDEDLENQLRVQRSKTVARKRKKKIMKVVIIQKII